MDRVKTSSFSVPASPDAEFDLDFLEFEVGEPRWPRRRTIGFALAIGLTGWAFIAALIWFL